MTHTMTQWQPIETAPLDGRPFVASYKWLGDPHCMIIRRSDRGPWWIMHGTSQCVGDEKGAIRFLRWQPLPSLDGALGETLNPTAAEK